MSVLKNFKNIPRSPYEGRQGSNVTFSSSNLQRSLWRKKKRGPVAPPNGRQDPVAHPRGDRALSPVGGRQDPYFPLSFEPKNSGKKRGVMKHRSINIPSIVCNGKYESDQ